MKALCRSCAMWTIIIVSDRSPLGSLIVRGSGDRESDPSTRMLSARFSRSGPPTASAP